MPLPGLVFGASSRAWRVWAVKGSRRPTLGTPLFQAPFFNVNAHGHICQGNVPVPEGTTVEKIGAWNDAFFHSYFTHPNVVGKLLNYRGAFEFVSTWLGSVRVRKRSMNEITASPAVPPVSFTTSSTLRRT